MMYPTPPATLLTPLRRWAPLLAVNLALIAWIKFRPDTANPVDWIVFTLATLSASLATFACLPRRRLSPDSPPLALLPQYCFFLGLLFFTAGDVSYYLYPLLFDADPFPSVADVSYLLSYPFLTVGVLTLSASRRPAGPSTRVAAFLDSLIATAAFTTLSWYFLISGILLNPTVPPHERALAAAYPVLDLILLFALLVAAGPAVRRQPATLAIVAGLLAIIAADSIYAYQDFRGTWVDGSLYDALWPVAYMLMARGAADSRSAPAPAAPPAGAAAPAVPPLWRQLLPYAPSLPVVAILLCTNPATGDTARHYGAYLGFIILVALILLRQVLAIRDNARLSAHAVTALHDLQASHAKLARAETQFRTVFQQAGLGIVLTVDGHLTHANPAFLRFLGYTQSELANLTVGDIVHPDDRFTGARQFTDLLSGATDRYTADRRYLHKDGSTRHGRVTVSRFPAGPDGKHVVLALVEDTTATRQANRLAQATLDALNKQIAIVDLAGTLLSVNSAWSRQFVTTPSQAADDPPPARPGDNYLTTLEASPSACGGRAAQLADGIRLVLTGDAPSFTLEYRLAPRADQHGAAPADRWFLARVTPFDLDGHPRAVIVHENITPAKRVESLEHRQAALRDAVGAQEQLLSVLRHELRVPLADLCALTHSLASPDAAPSHCTTRLLPAIHSRLAGLSTTVATLLQPAHLKQQLQVPQTRAASDNSATPATALPN